MNIMQGDLLVKKSCNGYHILLAMALLDVAKASQYGLAATWAEQVFTGKMRLGNISVDYTNRCASLDTWGNCESRTSSRSAPALFNSSSTASGSGLSINGGKFLASDGTTSSAFNTMVTVANAAAPMNFKGIALQSGNINNSSTNAGVSLYIDSGNFNPGGISFIQDGSTASIGAGKVTTSNKQLASGAGASVTFTFIPNANPLFELSTNSSNSVTATTSNGIENSSSSKQTASLSFSNSTKASAGVKIGPASTSVENETNIQAGWQGSWTNINSVNFSESSQDYVAQTSEVKVTLDLNKLEKNKDGLYGYNESTPTNLIDEIAKFTTIPSGGTGHESVSNFVPGQKYKAVIQYNQSNVENTVSGSLKIGGSVGSIVANNMGKKKLGNTIVLTAAQAISAANIYQGSSIFGYDASSLGTLNGAGNEIPFNGTSVFSTSLQTDFSVNYYAVASPTSILSSSSLAYDSQGLKNNTGAVNKYNLGLVDSSLTKADNGVWLALETIDGDKSIVSGAGGGGNNVVEASPSGEHKFINFKNTMIYGNDNTDIVELSQGDQGNTIYVEQGDDTVSVEASNNNVLLGDGDDNYYLIGGMNNTVTLGQGEDTIYVNKAIKDSFHISDFDYIEDMFVLSGGLKKKEFKTKLLNPGNQNNLDGASLEFYYGKIRVGTAAISRDGSSYEALTNNNKAQELAFLNAKHYKLDNFLDIMNGEPAPPQAQVFKQSVLGQGLLTTKTHSPSDWSEMSNDKRSVIINQVMKATPNTKAGKKYWKNILTDQGSAVDEFSIEMVRDQLWWGANTDITTSIG